MNRIVTIVSLNSPFQVSTKKLFSKQREVPMQRFTFKEKHFSKIEDVVACNYIEDAYVRPCVIRRQQSLKQRSLTIGIFRQRGSCYFEVRVKGCGGAKNCADDRADDELRSLRQICNILRDDGNNLGSYRKYWHISNLTALTDVIFHSLRSLHALGPDISRTIGWVNCPDDGTCMHCGDIKLYLRADKIGKSLANSRMGN